MRKLFSFFILQQLSISVQSQSTFDKSIDVTDLSNVIILLHNATINARTKSGILSSEKISEQHQIELKSISGNISVYKTK